MSTPSPFGGRVAQRFPSLPKGVTVASFETYQEAQAAVDKLAKAAFPVKELAIVGTDLTSVERITGTLSWGRAAGAGAISGAWFGTFLGLLFFIFAPSGATLGILGSAVLIGAGFGMIFSVVSYSVNRRRRDFTSNIQVLARHYAIIITDPSHVARARNLLGTAGEAAPVVQAPVARPPAPPAPPAAPAPRPSEPEVAASVGDEASPAADHDQSQGLTYGEAQDAARRAAREAEAAHRRSSEGDGA